MAIHIVQPGETRTRVTRSPNMPVAGTLMPMGLYPLNFTMVLPGETLKGMSTKLRLISRPVKHPLAGCWYEGWMFYIKLTDMDRSLGEMFISDDVDPTPHLAAADRPKFFTKLGQVDWIKKCYDRVIESYFVHQDETAPTIDGVAMAKLQNLWWGQNLQFQDLTGGATPTPDTAGPIDAYEMARIMGMTEISYEQYLKQYGVQSVKTEIGKPEILRYWRSWTQPTNTIDPATGAPSSAWTWSEDIKAEKDIYFREPGFLLMMQAVRPKFYLPQVTASLAGEMWGFSDFFPAYNLDDPAYAVKGFMPSNKIMSGVGGADTKPLWVDRSDFLSHGEQFVNDWTDGPRLPRASGISFAASATKAQLRGEYPTVADVQDLFTAKATRNDTIVYYEGISSLRIAGHIKDQTPRGV